MNYKKFCGIALLVLSVSAQAGAPFENGLVPIEIFSEATGGGIPYRGLPDDFPLPAALPAGLNFQLAATVITGTTQQLILRTTDFSSLRTALVAGYQAVGWIDVASTLFVSPASISLCHEELGSISVSSYNSNSNGSTKFTLSRSPKIIHPGVQTCAQQKQSRDAQQAGNTAVAGMMPKFTLPPASEVINVPRLVSFIGGASSFTATEAVYNREDEQSFKLPGLTMSIAFTDFATQLQQQGWTVDSDDVGSRSSASVWFKTQSIATPTGGTQQANLTGTLEILLLAPDTFRYRFLLRAVVPATTTP